MAAPKSTRATSAKSTTLYLGTDVLGKLEYFADATVRSKSQAAEYLIRMGLERFIETGQEEPKDEPKLTKKRGRQPKKVSVATAKVEEEVKTEVVSEAPARRRGRPPRAEGAQDKATVKRKPRAKKAA